MEKIKIYHAFNGFLYAPVFLADEQGFFPKNTELIYTGGDKSAIELLCSFTNNDEKNSFAICDPFSVDLNQALEHVDDDICVVASLINVIPLWVFNRSPSLKPVRNESDLAKYKQNIKRIVLYPKETTGNLIGKRVQHCVGLMDQFVELKEFGKEFDSPIEDTDLIVTADVLRMVRYGLSKGNMIYAYATQSPEELNPFLFTGILTLRSTVKSNLWTVLSVLGAIRTAINCLSVPNVDQQYIDALVKRFEPSFTELSITSLDEKRTLVRDSLSYMIATEKLYADYPRPKKEQWTKAWDNARVQWKKENPNKEYPTVREKEEEIPALLVMPGWKIELLDYFKKIIYATDKDKESITTEEKKEFLKPVAKTVLILGAFFFIASTLLVYRAAVYTFFQPIVLSSGAKEYLSRWSFGADVLLLIAQGVAFVFLRKSILRFSKFEVELALWLGILGAFAAFIFRVLEI